MTKNSKAIALICGSTAVIATIIFYLMTFDNIFTIPMRWMSLIMLLVAEVVGTAKALTVKKSIFGISTITTSLIHLVIVLVMSIVFVNLMPFNIKTYILLNILFLGVLLVVDILILFFEGYISGKDKKQYESKAVVGSCYTKAQSISIEYESTEYKNDLCEIAEMLKYSDDSELSGDEVTISDKLDELNSMLDEKAEDIIDKIDEIKNLIKLRSMKIAGAKRGKF